MEAGKMTKYRRQSPRILQGKKEVRGYIKRDGEERKLIEALEFFCDKLKEESSADAKVDTEAEYNIPIEIVKAPEIPFRKELPMHMEYEVYIG